MTKDGLFFERQKIKKKNTYMFRVYICNKFLYVFIINETNRKSI